MQKITSFFDGFREAIEAMPPEQFVTLCLILAISSFFCFIPLAEYIFKEKEPWIKWIVDLDPHDEETAKFIKAEEEKEKAYMRRVRNPDELI